jgi:hypothetical protein
MEMAGLAHGLAHTSAKPLEQAKKWLYAAACKAVYTGSIPVGAFQSERVFWLWSGVPRAVFGLCLVRLVPVVTGYFVA